MLGVVGLVGKRYFTESRWEGQLSCLQLVGQSISHLFRGALMPSSPSPYSLQSPQDLHPLLCTPNPPVHPLPIPDIFTNIPPDSGVSVFNPSRNLYMSHLGYLGSKVHRRPVEKEVCAADINLSRHMPRFTSML